MELNIPVELAIAFSEALIAKTEQEIAERREKIRDRVSEKKFWVWSKFKYLPRKDFMSQDEIDEIVEYEIPYCLKIDLAKFKRVNETYKFKQSIGNKHVNCWVVPEYRDIFLEVRANMPDMSRLPLHEANDIK